MLVAVEFTGQRRRLTASARLARDAAAVGPDADEESSSSNEVPSATEGETSNTFLHAFD